MSRVVIWPVLCGAVTIGVLVGWRGFFWQHALIVGIGVAALTYTGIRTVQRLKDLYSHPE